MPDAKPHWLQLEWEWILCLLHCPVTRLRKCPAILQLAESVKAIWLRKLTRWVEKWGKLPMQQVSSSVCSIHPAGPPHMVHAVSQIIWLTKKLCVRYWKNSPDSLLLKLLQRNCC